MKYKKNHYGTQEDYDDGEVSDMRKGSKRRPIRNWTKAFVEHQDDYDEYDDFHNHRIKS